MVDVAVNYDAADNCTQGAGIVSTLTVSCNEQIADTDYEIVDAHHVRLLAERDSNGTGRIYTITITCTDGHGNASSKDVTVVVPHDQK
jgi:hypothetical protein